MPPTTMTPPAGARLVKIALVSISFTLSSRSTGNDPLAGRRAQLATAMIYLHRGEPAFAATRR